MRTFTAVSLLAALALLTRVGDDPASATSDTPAKPAWAGIHVASSAQSVPEGELVAVGDVMLTRSPRGN